MRRIFIALFIAGLIVNAAQAGIVSDACYQLSDNNCDFYQSCLEKEKPCGESGYAISYGDHYCRKFLKMENKLSSKGQKFFKNVRTCLQKELQLDILTHVFNRVNTLTCERIAEKAFRSHSYCYTSQEISICSLSPIRDLPLIFAEYEADDLLTRESAKQMSEVAEICLAQLVKKSFSSEMSLGYNINSDEQEKMQFWQSVLDHK